MQDLGAGVKPRLIHSAQIKGGREGRGESYHMISLQYLGLDRTQETEAIVC